eukprot:8423-Heterococcus_DN1.PRE.1
MLLTVTATVTVSPNGQRCTTLIVSTSKPGQCHMLLTEMDAISVLSKRTLHFSVGRVQRHAELYTLAGLQWVALGIDLTHK